jgi:anaerobic ribonucleoside-triphosphate reductase activating protein
MNYCAIYKADMINGHGVRCTLFVSGCHHHCAGCFNQKAWDEEYGIPYTKDTEDFLINHLKVPYISGLTILGGEPMEPSHQADVWNLISRVRSELPGRTVWLYSGYTLEELQEMKTPHVKDILSNVDVLIDGRFVQSLADPDLAFKGSSNQRVIDMKQTLQKGSVVLYM